MNCYAIELPLDEAQQSFDRSMSQASLVYMLPPQTIAEESAHQGYVHRLAEANRQAWFASPCPRKRRCGRDRPGPAQDRQASSIAIRHVNQTRVGVLKCFSCMAPGGLRWRRKVIADLSWQKGI